MPSSSSVAGLRAAAAKAPAAPAAPAALDRWHRADATPAARRQFWSRRVRIFNLEGTLVHTLPDLASALNHALRELGFAAVPHSLARASLHAGLEGSAAAAVAYQRLPQGVMAPLLARLQRRYLATMTLRSAPYDGVPQLLARLSALRQPMAVCSNLPQRTAEQLLEALGLDGHFTQVVGADTCGERKPHPAPLRRALVRLGARPAEALMIGDSAVDAASALAAGVGHLWFDGGYGLPPPLYPWRFHAWRDLLAAAPPIVTPSPAFALAPSRAVEPPARSLPPFLSLPA